MDTYSYDLVQRLSFLRFGGTEGEVQAADCLVREIEALGGTATVEEFSVPAWECKHCTLQAVSPYRQDYPVIPFGMCGSLPEGGVDLSLLYLEDCSEEGLYRQEDLSHTAVLVDELTLKGYRLLCKRNAAAVLVVAGKWYDSEETLDLPKRCLRPSFLQEGKLPTFYLWAKDAIDLVGREAQTVHLELIQVEKEHTSRNVVAVIPGQELTEESVMITAHYDSVVVGTGAWDNATGTATVMYIYRHFLKNPPKRTLRFVFCGSEEQGLYGSKAYLEAHKEAVGQEIKFGFNFDMCGTTLGKNKIFATGSEELLHYAKAFCREYGRVTAVYREVRSSDSAPLADLGVPVLDLFRGCPAAEIHTRKDLMAPISAKQLQLDGDFAVAMIARVANSFRLPVDLGMPDDMKEKLDSYFQRKKE